MNTITHDPTRGWLLLTPGGQIEIDPKEWSGVIKALHGELVIKSNFKYSVDAEFEVKWQILNVHDKWVDIDHTPEDTNPDTAWPQNRQIARLVKAKEESNNNMNYSDFKKFTLLNPTDSVTSDGCKATCACVLSDTPCNPNCSCKNPVMSGGCYNCATYGNEEQRKRAAESIQKRLQDFLKEPTMKDEGVDLMEGTRPDHYDAAKHAAWHCVRQFRELPVEKQIQYFINAGVIHGKSQPTESQDELWKDLIDVYDVEDRKGYGYATLIKALSARFRIERI